jgi:hypothetical protein
LQNRLTPKRILLLGHDTPVTPQEIIDQIPALKNHFPKTLFGAGTLYNFQQLNVGRFRADVADFISFAAHPQEHAFDDLTMIENLGAQEDVINSGQAIYPGRAMCISPITLRKRFNPYTPDPNKRVMTEDERSDPRQTTPFCAVWTLGSIKHLTEAGAASVTYFQTHGSQGVVSPEGEPYPVYHALKTVLQLPRNIVSSYSTHPLYADALVIENKGTLVWNYTAAPLTVYLDDVATVISPYEIRWQALGN